MSRFCEQCGAPLNSNGNFCSNCGAKVIRDESPPVTKPPPTTDTAQNSESTPSPETTTEHDTESKHNDSSQPPVTKPSPTTNAAQKSESTPSPETTTGHDTESKHNDSLQPPVQATPATSSSKADNKPSGRFWVKIIGGVFVLAIVIGVIASSSKDTSYSSNKPTQTEKPTHTEETPVKSQSATVPDVVGKTQSDAESTLKAAGFEVKISDDYSDSVPAGKIISQSPNSGAKIEKGQTVYVYVSKGANDGYNYKCTVDGTTTYKGVMRKGFACALYAYETQKAISDRYTSKTARGTFYIVTAIVGNNTNAPIMNPKLYLVDDSGRKYSTSFEATSTFIAMNKIEIEFKLNPGPQFAYKVYDIPDGVNITGLCCEAITEDFDTIEFNLPFRVVTE